MASPSMPAAGQLLAGRFLLGRVAGEGGMGTVYCAEDRQSGATVAVKLLRAGPGNPSYPQRFRLEAELLAQLGHPGIVRHVAHGVDDDGLLYLAMEWLEGEALSSRLRRGALPAEESLRLLSQAALALAVAHRAGIVHRDLKPANLFLVPGPDGVVLKVLDFGIARVLEAASGATRTGMVIGTPRYMAPEQARASRRADPRADVYSLGCVLFECLTGRPPIDGPSELAVLAKVLFEGPPPLEHHLPDAHPLLAQLFQKLVARDPAARPADGQALLAELSGVSAVLVADQPVPGGRGPARASLGRQEQRFVFVVLARPQAEPAGTATWVEATVDGLSASTVEAGPTPVQDRLQQALGDEADSLEQMADGSVAVALGASGHPTDQALRAVGVARRLRELLPAARVALASGTGVVERHRRPVGEAIERAAQLLEVPGPGQIAIDAGTAALLQGRCALAPAGPVFLLEDEPVVGAGPEHVLLGRPSPCVGRDRELSGLQALFDECAGESVARVGLVTGPPGIGKSRLLHEALGRLRGAHDTVTVRVARGDPMSEGAPLHLLAQLVRNSLGLGAGQSPAEQQSQLLDTAGRLCGELEAQRVAEFLGELLGVPFSDEHRPQLQAARHDARVLGDQQQRAFEDWLRGQTGLGPVVVALEDLHLADAATLRYLQAALRNLADQPLLVLGTARPQLLGEQPHLFAGLGLAHIDLGPLGRRAAERLIIASLGERVGAEAGRLIELSGGNAFYLEELIRAVASGRQELPPTLLAMVQARFDGLHAELRRVLRAASVFGERCTAGGLLALLTAGSGAVPPPLGPWVRELIEAEILRTQPAAEGLPPAEAELAFRHGLLRDAAYATLTAEDRVIGHRLAGEWLERAGDTQPLVLAEHFERGEEPLRAALLYRRAAEQALASSDLEAALELVARARRCGARAGEQARLGWIEAQAHNWKGDHRRAEEVALGVLPLVRPGSAPWFALAAELAQARGGLAAFDELEAQADDLFGQAAVGDGAGSAGLAARARVMALCHVVVQLFMGGRYAVAVPLLRRLREEGAALTGQPAVAAMLERASAVACSCTGEVGGALVRTRRAVALYDEAGDQRMACRQRINLGDALKEVGAYEEAVEVLREALATARRLGLVGLADVARHNLGHALGPLGHPAEAAAVLHEAIEGFSARGDRRLEATSRIYLTLLHLQRPGGLEAAARAVTAAVSTASGLNEEPLALALMARVRRREGALPAALELSARALEGLLQTGAIDEGEAQIYLARAEALEAAGQTSQLVALLEQARARLQRRAGRIDDPARRASFLTRVPENAALLSMSAGQL